ncbi:c-type cytochrome [Pseudomonas sp. SH1-B]
MKLRSLALLSALLVGGCDNAPELVVSGVGTGHAAAGHRAFHQFGCTSCHVIPGVVGADTHVGPPLIDIAQRKYLAGVLPNTPANLVRWLRAPQAIAPDSAMPDLGVDRQSALDMAAYLYGSVPPPTQTAIEPGEGGGGQAMHHH